MASIHRNHPKRAKYCVFCKYWFGDAGMKYLNNAQGFEYDGSAKGKCAKRDGAVTLATITCSKYEPSIDAQKLL